MELSDAGEIVRYDVMDDEPKVIISTGKTIVINMAEEWKEDKYSSVKKNVLDIFRKSKILSLFKHQP